MRTKEGRIVLVTLFAVFLLPSIALAVDCTIADTGQTNCYDNDSEITCPSPGEDFYGQDAQYGPNLHSYTKLDENGNDLPDEATSWVMVRDKVTGLVWEMKQNKDDVPDYNNPHDADNTYKWHDAQDIFIGALNSAQFGGYSDWRLPTVKELASIIDRATYNPSINTTYFPNTQEFFYWSSTTYTGYPDITWTVSFLNAYLGYVTKSGYNYMCGRFMEDKHRIALLIMETEL